MGQGYNLQGNIGIYNRYTTNLLPIQAFDVGSRQGSRYVQPDPRVWYRPELYHRLGSRLGLGLGLGFYCGIKQVGSLKQVKEVVRSGLYLGGIGISVVDFRP